MATRNYPETTIAFVCVVQENRDGDEIEIRMWEKGKILVPFKTRTFRWRFEVQFSMMQRDIWTNQLLEDVEYLLVKHQFPERLMTSDGIIYSLDIAAS